MIPPDIRRLIATTVPSVPFLEALLLFRAAAGRPLAVGEIARQLYLTEQATTAVVEALAAARIVTPEPSGSASNGRSRSGWSTEPCRKSTRPSAASSCRDCAGDPLRRTHRKGFA